MTQSQSHAGPQTKWLRSSLTASETCFVFWEYSEIQKTCRSKFNLANQNETGVTTVVSDGIVCCCLSNIFTNFYDTSLDSLNTVLIAKDTLIPPSLLKYFFPDTHHISWNVLYIRISFLNNYFFLHRHLQRLPILFLLTHNWHKHFFILQLNYFLHVKIFETADNCVNLSLCPLTVPSLYFQHTIFMPNCASDQDILRSFSAKLVCLIHYNRWGKLCALCVVNISYQGHGVPVLCHS